MKRGKYMTEQDLSKLDDQELMELLATLEGMDDYLEEQEESANK